MMASVDAAQLSAQVPSASLKDKYSELCRNFDEQRAAADKVQADLYKSLLRLTFAFKGRNEELDAQLVALRDALRQGLDAGKRKRRIDEVVAAIVALPDSGDESADAALLIELLDRLDLADSKAFELKQIKSKLEKADDPVTLLGLVADLINDPDTASPPAPDLFGEFLAGLELPDTASETVARLRRRLSSAADHSARLQVVDAALGLLSQSMPQDISTDADVNDFLLALMDWILFPGEFEKPAAQLRVKLQDPPSNWDPIRATAGLFNELQAFLRRDLRELEGYLQRATVQLSNLEAQLQTGVASSAKSVADSDELSRDIGAEMEQITDAVDAGASGSALKQLVDRRVASASGCMQAFLSAQHDRHSAYEARIERLTKELQVLERESENLRTSLVEEHHKAYRDALTNVPNRLAFEERCVEEFERWQRYDGELSVAVIDLDRFKSVNDTYGHTAGDRVLVHIADLCAQRVRTNDFFARYGGEEFVALFPGTGLNEACGVAEYVRQQIASCTFHHQGKPVAITVSIGVAELHPKDIFEQAFKRADEALYAAKSAGRNAVVDETGAKFSVTREPGIRQPA